MKYKQYVSAMGTASLTVQLYRHLSAFKMFVVVTKKLVIISSFFLMLVGRCENSFGGAECWLCFVYALKYCSVHQSLSEHDFIVLHL